MQKKVSKHEQRHGYYHDDYEAEKCIAHCYALLLF